MKNTLKYTLVFLCTVLCFSIFGVMAPVAFASDEVASGSCGENVLWSLDSEGTLTISGLGPMEDYANNSSATPWINYCNTLKQVVIQDGVTSIGDYSFFNCSSISSVEISNSVTVIGKSAFYGCHGINSIHIPESVVEIRDEAFYICQGLNDIMLSHNMTSIGKQVFRYCSALQNIVIPEGIISIGESAFEASALSSIHLPKSLKSIGLYAFRDCSSLTDVYHPGPMVLKDTISIRNDWETNNTIINATWHFDIIDEGEINESLSWVLNGEGVLTISGTGAMADYIDDSVEAHWAPWRNKRTSIKSLVINEGVTSIGDNAFNACVYLSNASLPEGLISIGDGAFCGNGLTTITIPASVTSIYVTAFTQGWIQEINVCEGNKSYSSENGILFNADKTKLIRFPDGRSGAFTIPNGVSTIGDSAFYWCHGLTEVIIPPGVKALEYWAFGSCLNLTKITIPTSITSIDRTAFNACDNLRDIYYGGTEEQWRSIYNATLANTVIHYACCGDNLTWSLSADGTLTISGTGVMTDYPVGGAPWYVNKDSIKNVVIGPDVTYIGTNAFADCGNLKEIVFTGHMPGIGAGAFTGVSATVRYPAGDTTYEGDDNPLNDGSLILKPDCTMYGDHTISDPVRENEVPATCITEGHYDEVVYCSVCGDEISRQTITTPVSEQHTHGNPIQENIVSATCTESGSFDEVVYCSVCETELSRNHMTIEALGHDPGEAVRENVIPATETSDGSYDEVVYCTRCELELSRENFIIPMLLSPPEITAQPISTTAIEGAEAVFHASANGQELTYQWYSMAPNAVKWTAVTPGGDQPDLIVPATMALNNTRYYCKVSNPAGVAETEAVTLSVSKASAPIVTAQPASVKAVVNKTATFTVAAQGTGLTYQWYVQTKGSTAWTPVGGATSAKLTVTAAAALDGAKYRCVVTGEGGQSVTSGEAALTLVTAPKITTQPKKASVKAGKKVTFKVKASGYDLKYQWYYQKPGTKKWVKMGGKTKATLSFTAKKSKNGYKYRCYVTNAAGTVKSKAVKLTVK